MDLGDILRVIGKRWYIMLPMVLVTVAVTVAAYFQLPMKYESTSQISLLSPQQQASGTFRGQSNPFLIFDTSLTSTADLLSRSLGSDSSIKELKARGVTEEYTAKLADFAQGPFIQLTVTGTDKAHVLASTNTVTSFARDRLRQIQQQNGVPADNMIQTTVLIPPQPPAPLVKSKLQIVLALLAAGLVTAFMATFVTEGLSRSRSRSRHHASSPGAGAGTAKVATPGGSADDGPLGDTVRVAQSDDTMVIRLPKNLAVPVSGIPAPRDAPALDAIPSRHGTDAWNGSSNGWTEDSPTELFLAIPTDQPAVNGSSNGNGKGNSPHSSALYRSASATRPDEDARADAED
jgi:hypothetical protein